MNCIHSNFHNTVEMKAAPFRAFTLSSRNLCLIPRNDIENPLSMGMISSLADILKFSEHANAMVHPFGAMHHFRVLNGSR